MRTDILNDRSVCSLSEEMKEVSALAKDIQTSMEKLDASLAEAERLVDVILNMEIFPKGEK